MPREDQDANQEATETSTPENAPETHSSEPASIADVVTRELSGSQEANPGDEADARGDLAPDPANQEAEGGDGDGAGQETEGGSGADADADGEDDDAKLWEGASDEEIQAKLDDKKTTGGLRKNLKRILKLKERVRELSGQVEQTTPVVEATKPIYEAMQQHGLNQQNMQELIQVGALLRRGDYEGFAKAVQPYIDRAQQATGQRLPDDLQSQVDAGYVTADVARELARRRYEGERQKQELASVQQQRQQDAARVQQQQRVNTVRDAFNAWEQNLMSSDPDYPRLREAVQEQVKLEVQASGVPGSVEQANEMAKRAYQRVRKLAAPAAPKKPTAPRPASGHSNSGVQAPKEPTSVHDIVAQTLAG